MKISFKNKGCSSTSWRLSVLALVVVALSTMPGCTQDKENRKIISERTDQAQQGLESIEHPVDAQHYNPLVVTDKVWVGDTALRMHRGMPLPAKYETARGITLVSADPMSLADIATAIGVQTGISVRTSDIGAAKAGAAAANLMPISYEGSLSGLMERLAGYYGINWHFDGTSITISRFETRVFVIEALPGTQSVVEGMAEDTGAGASATGATASTAPAPAMTQNSKVSMDFKYWDELGQILTSMLGGTGTIVVAPSSGTVTISTTPEIMRTVTTYLEEENKRLSRQIAINVEIYSVSLAKDEDFNVNFNAVMKRLGYIAPTTLTGGAAPAEAGTLSVLGSLGVGVINPQGTSHLTDVFSALSAIGNTTEVAKFPLLTLNNRPVSRRIGTDYGYVQSTTTTSAGTGGALAGTSITPGTVHEGYSVQVTPRLLDDGRIILQYSLNLTGLNGFVTFNSVCGSAPSSSCTAGAGGSSSVQVPQTTSRIFVQQSILRSGAMLVVGGIDDEKEAQNNQGIGEATNYWLGGGASNSMTHTTLFMVITPQVIDAPHSEQY